jgi:hypothetical protein
VIWGDGTATEAMIRAFEERGYPIRATENGLRFEIFPGDHSRRRPKPPLAVLWCPLTPGEPFQWITDELIGADPRSVLLMAWCDLLPYVCEGSTVPFELAREVVDTIEPRGGEQGGERGGSESASEATDRAGKESVAA